MEKEDSLLESAKSIIMNVPLNVIKDKIRSVSNPYDYDFWEGIYCLAKKYREK